jgi:hypothetical protein
MVVITSRQCESHYLCESGILDAHFYLMMHLKNVVKEGRGETDIMNSADVVSALNANGGIASSCSHQYILNREIKLNSMKRITNIRCYHERNFTYHKGYVRANLRRHSFQYFYLSNN